MGSSRRQQQHRLRGHWRRPRQRAGRSAPSQPSLVGEAARLRHESISLSGGIYTHPSKSIKPSESIPPIGETTGNTRTCNLLGSSVNKGYSLPPGIQSQGEDFGGFMNHSRAAAQEVLGTRSTARVTASTNKATSTITTHPF